MKTLLKWSAIAALACSALIAARTSASPQGPPQAPPKAMPAANPSSVSLSSHRIRPKPGGNLHVTIDLNGLDHNQVKSYNWTFYNKHGAVEAGWTQVGPARPHKSLGRNLATLKFKAPAALRDRPVLLDGTGTLVVTVTPTDNTTDIPLVPTIPIDDTGVDPCDDN